MIRTFCCCWTQPRLPSPGDIQIVSGGTYNLVDLKKWSTPTSARNLGLELDLKPTYCTWKNLYTYRLDLNCIR